MSEARIDTIPVHTQDLGTPPGFAIRTFWLLHRALDRLSGGRLGLPHPEAGTKTSVVSIERPRPLALHPAWLVPGLAVAVLANAQATEHGLGLVPLLVFGIVPHLSVLVGIGQPHARGQLAPRAVPLFNAMHHPGLPLALLTLAAAGILPNFWLVGALAWLGHIAVDRGLGDGPRTADGWQRRLPIGSAPE